MNTKRLGAPVLNHRRSETPLLKELLDLEQLKKLFRYFSVVSGLDLALFDESGREVLVNRKSGSVCAATKNCWKCREYLTYGGIMSSDLGDPYIYACGCGLIMCSSPVMFNERLVGSIACGPTILWDADEIAVLEIEEHTRDMLINLSSEDFLRNTPSCSCENISSLAQLLFIIVDSLTKEHSRYLNQRAQIAEQQARISELLIDRNIAAAELIKLEERSTVLAYPVETEKELIAFVQSGNKQQATKILNNLLGEIFYLAEGNLDTIRVKLFELVAFLSRAAVDAGAPLRDVKRITKDSFEICEDSTDFEHLCFLTTQAMERFIDTVYQNRTQRQTSQPLSRAIEYVRHHYASDLSLSAVADAVFVSKYYLSHLFQKEMKTTFSSYIRRIRIEMAKRFIKEDNTAQIQEIASRVGFNDANYFTKVFKKFSGVTPKEYQTFFKV
ncbi:MAG: PocR ligand-binding domain-containing protein [Treponema sp.]|jgi:two-component system response regulator YesN|nr:PocR ligand-binding domain-containing protein [Treponema sp.]